ncbi:MAG TPA: cell envelope integrity protein TolA [Xanthomonadaceae bacterium]|jgi:colicin import membrane protein
MESNSDRLRAFGLSLGLHALVLFVLYRGLMAQTELQAADAEGPAIEATLVSAPQRSVASARPVAASHHPVQPVAQPPVAQPEPTPQDSPQPRQLVSQTQVPKPDTVDQDEVRRTAQLAAEHAQQEQEERRRQAQVDLDRKQEQLQAESRQRQAQQDIDKQLAAIRKARAEQEHQAKLAQEKIKQDEDLRKALAQNSAPATAATTPATHQAPGNNGDKSGLLAKYKQAIIDTTNQNWIHSDDVPQQVHCHVHFTQIPGGVVTAVDFKDCPFDAAGRESVNRAMLKTPLPYAGFESVFPQLRQGELDFCYPTEKCSK